MRVLLIGVGTVGEAIARISAKADWCEAMILADYDETEVKAIVLDLESGRWSRAARSRLPWRADHSVVAAEEEVIVWVAGPVPARPRMTCPTIPGAGSHPARWTVAMRIPPFGRTTR